MNEELSLPNDLPILDFVDRLQIPAHMQYRFRV